MKLTPHIPGPFGPASDVYVYRTPVGIPVPTQNELLSREQAIKIIEAHTPIKDEEDRIWLRVSTLFTILEGDENNGRAIVASPKNTALALGAYDLFPSTEDLQAHRYCR